MECGRERAETSATDQDWVQIFKKQDDGCQWGAWEDTGCSTRSGERELMALILGSSILSGLHYEQRRTSVQPKEAPNVDGQGRYESEKAHVQRRMNQC